MSRDICGSQNWWGILLAISGERDMAEPPTVHKTAPTTKNYLPHLSIVLRQTHKALESKETRTPKCHNPPEGLCALLFTSVDRVPSVPIISEFSSSHCSVSLGQSQNCTQRQEIANFRERRGEFCPLEKVSCRIETSAGKPLRIKPRIFWTSEDARER